MRPADASHPVLERHAIEALAEAIAMAHASAEPSAGASGSRAGFHRKCRGGITLDAVTAKGGGWGLAPLPGAGADMDVIADLAPLLAQLDGLGHRRLANIALNRYLDFTGDIAGLAVLAGLLWGGAVRDGGRPSPWLVGVGGLSGGGKSRMGREVAPFLGPPPGARIVRTDVVRKRLMGVHPLSTLGPEGYTDAMHERTYAAFMDELRAVLRAGWCALADAVFALAGQRQALEELARAEGVGFAGLWVEAPIAVRIERVLGRKNNVSDVTPAVMRQQLDYETGAITWTRIDSSGPREATLAAGLAALGLAE